MRNTSAALTFVVALIASPVASPQRTTAGQEPVASGDVSEFRALHNPVISADGVWMAAEERPDRPDGNVRVWSTEGDASFTIERGQNPRISRDSRWVSALQKPARNDSRTKPKKERAGQTLVLLNLQDGSQRKFDFVLSYDMTFSSTYLVYVQSTPETKPDAE